MQELHASTRLSGHVYVTPRIAREAIAAISAEAHSPMELLSSRQRDVLHRVVRGLTMKEVAAELSLSPRTVESHKYQAMQVLGVRTTAELIQYAIRHDASY